MRLQTGQAGWLDRPDSDGTSTLRLLAGEEGARLVLYAGQPQGDEIVSHGPCIGDSKRDIVRLYTEYRAGRFERMSALARRTRVA
jgi:redox-sensitive bicupin YhaK (pirin superfamily)